jgi:hypothetical protein
MLLVTRSAKKCPLCVLESVQPRPIFRSSSNAFPPSFLIATCNHSPLRQAQEQVPLWTLREARNSEPAHAPVAILIFRAGADADGVFDHIATGGGGVECGCVCESADELHLRERSGSGGGECAGAGAREGGAEGEHCVCVVFDVRCVWWCCRVVRAMRNGWMAYSWELSR